MNKGICQIWLFSRNKENLLIIQTAPKKKMKDWKIYVKQVIIKNVLITK